MLKKIKFHLKNQSFKDTFTKKISGNGVFMNILYGIASMNTKLTIKFLPFPRQNKTFMYFDEYLVEINPNKVLKVVNSKFEECYEPYPWNFVLKGSWDLDSVLLSDSSYLNDRYITVKTINQIFLENLSYQESDQYLDMKHTIEQGKIAYYWCKNLEDLDKYFNILIRLNDDIKNDNYITQKNLVNHIPERVNIREKGDEIRILIGREGNLILGSGGTHRLLLSQINNIERIPVIIEAVHYEWVKSNYQLIQKNGLLNFIKERFN